MKKIPSQVTLAAEDTFIFDVRIIHKPEEGLDGHVYFGEGWEQFRYNYSIESHDILVFTYDGDTHFWVTVFDRDGTERIIT